MESRTTTSRTTTKCGSSKITGTPTLRQPPGDIAGPRKTIKLPDEPLEYLEPISSGAVHLSLLRDRNRIDSQDFVAVPPPRSLLTSQVSSSLKLRKDGNSPFPSSCSSRRNPRTRNELAYLIVDLHGPSSVKYSHTHTEPETVSTQTSCLPLVSEVKDHSEEEGDIRRNNTMSSSDIKTNKPKTKTKPSSRSSFKLKAFLNLNKDSEVEGGDTKQHHGGASKWSFSGARLTSTFDTARSRFVNAMDRSHTAQAPESSPKSDDSTVAVKNRVTPEPELQVVGTAGENRSRSGSPSPGRISRASPLPVCMEDGEASHDHTGNTAGSINIVPSVNSSGSVLLEENCSVSKETDASGNSSPVNDDSASSSGKQVDKVPSGAIESIESVREDHIIRRRTFSSTSSSSSPALVTIDPAASPEKTNTQQQKQKQQVKEKRKPPPKPLPYASSRKPSADAGNISTHLSAKPNISTRSFSVDTVAMNTDSAKSLLHFASNKATVDKQDNVSFLSKSSASVLKSFPRSQPKSPSPIRSSPSSLSSSSTPSLSSFSTSSSKTPPRRSPKPPALYLAPISSTSSTNTSTNTSTTGFKTSPRLNAHKQLRPSPPKILPKSKSVDFKGKKNESISPRRVPPPPPPSAASASASTSSVSQLKKTRQAPDYSKSSSKHTPNVQNSGGRVAQPQGQSSKSTPSNVSCSPSKTISGPILRSTTFSLSRSQPIPASLLAKRASESGGETPTPIYEEIKSFEFGDGDSVRHSEGTKEGRSAKIGRSYSSLSRRRSYDVKEMSRKVGSASGGKLCSQIDVTFEDSDDERAVGEGKEDYVVMKSFIETGWEDNSDDDGIDQPEDTYVEMNTWQNDGGGGGVDDSVDDSKDLYVDMDSVNDFVDDSKENYVDMNSVNFVDDSKENYVDMKPCNKVNGGSSDDEEDSLYVEMNPSLLMPAPLTPAPVYEPTGSSLKSTPGLSSIYYASTDLLKGWKGKLKTK